jgi:prepilin-type processing-associated H-X9-DG protein
MLIEVDAEHAVPWMAPVDADEEMLLGINLESHLAHPGGMHGVFVDGHVDLLSAELPAEKRRALVTIAGRDNAELE